MLIVRNKIAHVYEAVHEVEINKKNYLQNTLKQEVLHKHIFYYIRI